MEKSYLKKQYLMLLIVVVSLICLHKTEAQVGACYGTLGNNLPQAEEVISLCNQYQIQRIRLYNPNPSALAALQGHENISVMVGVANEHIPWIAANSYLAKLWVHNNVVRYQNLNVRYIAVGNEILPSPPSGDASSTIAPSVAPAMVNIYNALLAFGLGGRVKVSTVLSMGVLGQSYPPSAGAFKTEFQDSFINPIVKFLVQTNSPFLINVYPYFTYTGEPNNIRLDYALFTSPSPVVTDGPYQYRSLFDAMVDAVYAALEKAGGADVEVVVSETGWPTDGGTATSIANAYTYNSNLVQSVKNGTPRRPGKAIETYIFDLIDENQKSPELEKHWGVFSADKQLKYTLSFT